MGIREKLHSAILVAVAMTAMVNAPAALAQVDSDSVARLERVLDETTVTAVRPVKNLRAATPTFTLDSKSVIRTGITDIADALHRLPGVNLRDYGGAGGLKTVSVRGLGAAHTTVNYDGLPLSDSQSGAIDLSRYSVDNTASLSLVIGDNDDIFIPARVAAAPASLSLNTPLPLEGKQFDLTARLKAGSFGYVSPYLNVSAKTSDRLTLNLSGEFLHVKNNYPFKWVNGKVTTIERRENNRMNSGHIETNLLWSPDEASRLTAKVYYYDNNRQLPGPVMYYNVNGSKEHLREKNAFAQASYTRFINDKWQFMAAGKFNWGASLYTDYGSRQAGNYVEENYFQREYYITANVLFRPSREWNFDYSADYFLNTLNSNLPDDIRPRRNSFLQALTARWTRQRFNLTARLVESIYISSAGLKEAKAPADCNSLSPSVSFSARLLNSGLLYGRVSYKNIFRMPTFNEAFFNHYGSPDLKPESTHQLDLGLSYQLPGLPFLSSGVITADVYRNWVTDRIVAVPYNMFMWIVTNVNSVIATGADLNLNATFALGKRQSIVLAGTWSYQRAKIDLEKGNIAYGKQVAYTPLNSGSFSIGYENPWVNLVWHGQGTSARYTDNVNTPAMRLPGYFEFGATAWKELSVGKTSLELRVDILNILDKQYFVVARYPMPGRSWQASVKFKI